jgi:hypothetical protein
MTDRFENPQDTISQRVANHRQWETPIRCRDNATSIRDLTPNHISPDFLNSYLYLPLSIVATYSQHMTRRWSHWHILILILALVPPSLIFLSPTVFNPNLVNLIDTSTGPSLERPKAEPTDADLGSAEVYMFDDTTRSFDVIAQIQPDHSVVITEKITQIFRTDRHGIERSIPIEYNGLGSHVIRAMQIATSEGTPNSLEISDLGGAVNVRIGDAAITITNAHTYELSYQIEDVLVINGDVATLPLDAITDWRQSIDSLTYTVIGPSDPLDTRCYQGAMNTQNPCSENTLTPDGARFSASNLAPNSAFTVEIDFPSSAFDATPTLTSRSQAVPTAVIAIALMYFALVAAVLINLTRYRRQRAMAIAGVTETFSGPMSIDLPDRMQRPILPPPPGSLSIVPTTTTQEMPVEFVPPVNLDPACLLRMKEGSKVNVSRMLASTLVDLAADGVISLTQVNQVWVVGRIDQPPRQVKSYELTLLNALLGDQNEAVLSQRNSALSANVKTYVQQVDDQLRSLGLLTDKTLNAGSIPRGGKIVARAALFGMIIVAAIFAAGVGSGTNTLNFFLPAGAIFIGGVTLAYGRLSHSGQIGSFTSRGLGTAVRAEGFERFFRESEAAHAQAAERMGLMREYMGYAVAFNAVNSWVNAMPKAQLEQWNMSTSPLLFATLPDQRIWSNATTTAYTPIRTENSGGFSSGGGFSGGGGGFGGGGGGSW